jgi:hypothetical protein
MQTRHFALGIALLLLTGVVSAAQAKTLHFHCKGAATVADGVETNIDTDGDGASATLDQGLTNCNIGRFFFQNEAEFILQPTVTTACPAGTSFELLIDSTQGQGRGVWTNEKTADQLFFQTSSATFCLNETDPSLPFTASGQTEAIGGTGKYVGATGTTEFHLTGSTLQFVLRTAPPGRFANTPPPLTAP